MTETPVDDTSTVQLRLVAPTQLTSHDNIRADLDLDDAFRASIRRLGVLSPIIAEPDMTGALVIRSGHRRAVAAAMEGLATVPVVVVPANSSNSDRLIAQIAENTARRDITTTDLLAGHEQLATFGIPIVDAAEATGMTHDQVVAARAAAAAPKAREAAGQRQLTLTQAAGLAEFEDEPDQLEQLLATLDQEPEAFEHHLQSLRDDRIRDQAVQQAAQDFKARGYTVLSQFPDRSVAQPLYALRDANNDRLADDEHTDCPGRAVTVRAGWTTDDDGTPVLAVQHFCADPSRHCNPSKPSNAGAPGQANSADEDRAEAAREQRRVTIANNKAWRSAETVRRRHLKQWLATATLKAPAARWIVAELAHGGLHRPREAAELARELVGADYGKAPNAPRWNQPPTSPPTRVNAARAHTLAAGLVLADMELGTSTESWRSSHPGSRTSRYLTFLTDQTGYTLSDVEKL